MIDLSGTVTLVTGGTMGIGLATGLAYGRAGSRVVLTHRWGSADEEEVHERFRVVGAPEPMIVEADVSRDEDTAALMDRIAEEHDDIRVLVSNVAFGLRVTGIDEYERRGLAQSIDYSTWPMVAYTRAIHERFGRYPRYVIGMSSDGPDGFFQNYDFVAMSKAMLETMCRYLNFRLFDERVRFNVIRSRLVRTASFDATFGAEFHEFLEALGGFDDCYTEPEQIGDVALALGSGLMDAVGGQVIMVDKGFEFFDNLMGIGERARKRGVRIAGPTQTEEE